MKYNIKSELAQEFVNEEFIEKTLENARKLASEKEYVNKIIDKALQFKGLEPNQVAVLSYVEDKMLLKRIFNAAATVKQHIYGKRIVMFAPLYLSDYCVNNCTYCGYHASSKMPRKKLTKAELIAEVEYLESMGHKRLAIEVGEDPKNCPLDYVLDCIKTIYSVKCKNGQIRRVNVNVAATTVEDYKKLKDAGIGTYILFQETYHKDTYEKVHPSGPKANYEYHTTAHDRAMQAGIDDVGVGVLYGLYDWHYEIVAQSLYAKHLESVYGVGPHTISVPRIKKVEGIENSYEHAVNDDDFKKIVAILRLAVPYTGLILSTREGQEFRKEIIKLGVSQVSAGSCTGVGGYTTKTQKPQFEVSDLRSPIEVTKELIEDGYIPSFCTACYREGRTGDRFMQLAKNGQIANICGANALLTLKEYAWDYGDAELKKKADELIEDSIKTIPSDIVKKKAQSYINEIEKGKRDFRF